MAAGDVAVSLINPISQSCASFDGVDDSIDLSTYLSELEINNSFSISLWCKNRSTSLQQLIDNVFNANNRFVLMNSNTILVADYNGAYINNKISSVMAKNVITIDSSDSIDNAAMIMSEHKIKRLLATEPEISSQ